MVGEARVQGEGSGRGGVHPLVKLMAGAGPKTVKWSNNAFNRACWLLQIFIVNGKSTKFYLYTHKTGNLQRFLAATSMYPTPYIITSSSRF